MRFVALLEEICWHLAMSLSGYRTENHVLCYTGEWDEFDRTENLVNHNSNSQKWI